ncbi:hypothetical protein GDO78_008792 [Eleutherodactylus coqui]|uniref:Uncharacterized protein n=1 Tax=Eleutherodactylus coqui TaxID=57060 RepID=A0A8J6FFX7_ELECQ|nr:hypothetical protein GDO78_008792 [Eleutherodactylus coqui]
MIQSQSISKQRAPSSSSPVQENFSKSYMQHAMSYHFSYIAKIAYEGSSLPSNILPPPIITWFSYFCQLLFCEILVLCVHVVVYSYM